MRSVTEITVGKNQGKPGTGETRSGGIIAELCLVLLFHLWSFEMKGVFAICRQSFQI
jgi:hypothetical protein